MQCRVLLAVPGVCPLRSDPPALLHAAAEHPPGHRRRLGLAARRGLWRPGRPDADFDRVAREGALFPLAFVSSPSCTPSRNAILTGQWHWRLGPGANLWSTLPQRPEALTRTCSGRRATTSATAAMPGAPAGWTPSGRPTTPPGRSSPGLPRIPPGPPRDSRSASGSAPPIRTGPTRRVRPARRPGPERINLPCLFPGHAIIRGDVADYYHEVQRFDRDLGEALRAAGRRSASWTTRWLSITGDHGMPFPRCKATCTTAAPRAAGVPLGPASKGRPHVHDFVSLTDLAPTFLEAAGVSRRPR